VKSQAVLRWVRLAVTVAAVLAGLYLWQRFDWVRLPETGCSPVFEVKPGAGLLVDKRPGELHVGDIVLYRGRDGTLLLGRLHEIRADALGEVAFDVRGDREECPSPDSETLGALPRRALAARLLIAWQG